MSWQPRGHLFEPLSSFICVNRTPRSVVDARVLPAVKTKAWEARALLQQLEPLNMERAEAIRSHGAIGGHVGGGGSWLARALAWVVGVFVFRQNWCGCPARSCCGLHAALQQCHDLTKLKHASWGPKFSHY